MILYHYTSAEHLPMILEARALLPTESNVGSPLPDWPPYGEHVGPDVVWLLDSPEADRESNGLAGSVVDKSRIRFEVDVKYGLAVPWGIWSETKKMHPEWYSAFVDAAGGVEVAQHWWVVPGRIGKKNWVSVFDRQEEELVVNW